MINSRSAVILAVFFPLVALGALTAYKHHLFTQGREVILPIQGYDPRDLISGHYLIYTIDYGVRKLCAGAPKEKKEGFLCLSDRSFAYEKPNSCPLLIEGTCKGQRFEAGIERYFTSKENALLLEKIIEKEKISVLISVNSGGKALVKDLLISDRPWKQVAQEKGY